MKEIREIVKSIFREGMDGITFVPNIEDNTSLQIRGFDFKIKSKYKKTDVGNIYHVLLFKCDETGKAKDIDNFTAVLTDPHVYTSNLISCDFYGVVAKQTAKSKKIINEMFEHLKLQALNYENFSSEKEKSKC
jgi:hypothetical protein